MVDDGCHTTDHTTVTISQIVFCLTKIEGGILVFAQCVAVVDIEIGHVVGIARIEVIMEFDEGFEILFGHNLFYFYR